ncbi:hypothetical protein Tco_0991867 [Tanacetum coccineum]|uniref:Uncharacterized protein n=1 Tax=Tanacetum coccineum TaxID=301880 RepID=A0ABQ5F178_9ASTR
MDIRDEIKASKVDKLTQSSLLSDSNVLPISSLLPDSDQNNLLNKPQLSYGVKGIVSPIKSKDTVNSDSPRHRRITITERDMLVSSNAQPVSQFNPITGELIMSSAKALKHKVPVKKSAAIMYKARKQKIPVKKPAAVVEKLDAVVDKEMKHKAPAKKPGSILVQDKDNVTASDKDNVVVNDPAELDQEKDKEKLKAPAKEPASVMGRVFDVAKQIMFHVEDVLNNEARAADAKEKSDENGKKSTVDKENDKIHGESHEIQAKNRFVVGSVYDVVKEISFDVVNEKASDACKNKATDDNAPNPNDNKSTAHLDVVSYVKSKVVVCVLKSKETPVKRKRIVSKEDERKKILKGKSKKEDSNSQIDVVDSSSDEADRKRKKLKD